MTVETRTHPTGETLAKPSLQFDWVMSILGLWLMVGTYLDGWAHNNIADQLESFFTPWHAVLYAGFFATAAALGIAWLRSLRRADRSLSPGYRLSLVGALVFVLGGVGDAIWHTLFGIEVNLDALFSPTHILLFVGGTLLVTGPLRTAWGQFAAQPRHLAPWTAVISLAFVLQTLVFMFQYASPLIWPWASMPTENAGPYFPRALGFSGIMLHTAFLMGVVLFGLRRWKLPTGSVTFLFGLTALTLIAMRYNEEYGPSLGLAQLLAGVLADLLLYRLGDRPGAVRILSFGVPIVLFALYFLALAWTGGILWSVHLWLGAIAMSGLVGLIVSYLVIPPGSRTIAQV